MAETLTTLKTRRSCRAYKPDHVELEKLDWSIAHMRENPIRRTSRIGTL